MPNRKWRAIGASFAQETPRKAEKKARQMILMVQAINKTNFGGRRAPVTCYTCHRNVQGAPKITAEAWRISTASRPRPIPIEVRD